MSVVWSAEGTTQTFSSPRCADLSGDGVLDVVLGHGVTAVDPERRSAVGSVTAHDGKTGALLWRHQSAREIVGSAALTDLNGDGVPDVAVGGRDGVFLALDGRDGRALWRFKGGRYNFYSPALVGDLDGDGVQDLLAATGGDVSIPPFAPRPPGELIAVSGASGRPLGRATTPDRQETYTSPLLTRLNGAPWVVFGTGGETHAGGLWRAPLASVVRGDLAGAHRIVAPTTHKGIIAPPALADLNGDGVEEIVAAMFDGRLVAVDGATGARLWSHGVAGGETYASPAIGRFIGDGRPDVFALINVGTWPRHTATVALLIDGASGRVGMRRQLEGIADGSPVAVDLDGDGLDEIFHWERRGERSVVVLTDAATGASRDVFDFLGRTPSSPWIGDLDGDGRLDWVQSTMQPPKAGGALRPKCAGCHTRPPPTGVELPPSHPAPDAAGASPTSAHADHAFEVAVRWRLERRTLDAKVPARIAWGAYLGTRGDGRYP